MAREQGADPDPEASLPTDSTTRDEPATQNISADRSDPKQRDDRSDSRLGRRDYLRATGLLAGSIGLGAVGTRAVAQDGPQSEVRSVTTNHDWTTVQLSNSYDTPVVLAQPPSYKGPQPASPRLRNVSGTSFDVAVQEWLYLDGWHRAETIGCFVTDAGSYSLADGTTVEAGKIRTNHRWSSTSFSASFSNAPVVFSQAQTVAGPQPIVTRQRNVSEWGLDVRVQEEEAQGPHRVEDVGYLAVEPGTGTLNGHAFEVGRKADVTDSWHTIAFDGSYSQPTFLADLQTFRGANTASVRYRNLTDSTVEVRVEEERSRDGETAHLGEVVGFLVVEGAESDSSGGDGSSGGDDSSGDDSSGDDDSSDGDTPLSELDRSRVEQKIHEYINERRAEHGLGALSFDSELQEIARYHSEDMAQNDYFSHTSPSGETRGDRYDKFGYDCRAYIDDSRYYTGAENIAYTFYDTDVRTDNGTVHYTNADELAEGLVTGWMNSPGHRENILTEAWDDEGIGVSITSEGKVYATQNFC